MGKTHFVCCLIYFVCSRLRVKIVQGSEQTKKVGARIFWNKIFLQEETEGERGRERERENASER